MGFADALASIGSSVASGIGALGELAVDLAPLAGLGVSIAGVAQDDQRLLNIGTVLAGGSPRPVQRPVGSQQIPFQGSSQSFGFGSTLPQSGGFTPGRDFFTPGDSMAFPVIQAGLPGAPQTLTERIFDIPGIDIVGGGQGAFLGAITSPFRASGARAVARTFAVPNPLTGMVTWFKPAGRPVLWSGDFAAAKRVKKVAAKARRRGGR